MLGSDNSLYRSRMVCGIITVPDGRVIAHRLIIAGIPSPWAAMLYTSGFGMQNPVVVMRRLVKDRYGLWPLPEEIRFILSHTRNPRSKLHYGEKGRQEIDIYHIDIEKIAEFDIKPGVETMALPFTTIINDLSSGAWQEHSVTVFNILGTMCKKEFRA